MRWRLISWRDWLAYLDDLVPDYTAELDSEIVIKGTKEMITIIKTTKIKINAEVICVAGAK